MLLIITLFLGYGSAFGQNKEQTEKKQKKEIKKEQLAENLAAIKAAVKDSAFVIEVNNIRGRYTTTNFVNPTTNFIQIENDEIIVQTADNFNVGYNGLGGITVRGNIINYEINEDDASIRLMVQMSSNALGFSTVNVSVNASGNATANLRTNFGGYAEFTGDFNLLENASTYEGMTIF